MTEIECGKLYAQLSQQFFGLYGENWQKTFAGSPELSKAVSNSWRNVLLQLEVTHFEGAMKQILAGESDFTAFPPKPLEFLGFARRTKRGDEHETGWADVEAPLTPAQKAYFAQCDRNSDDWRERLVKAKTGIEKMVITASAYYNGKDNIPNVEIGLYRMLWKSSQQIAKKQNPAGQI